MIHEGDTIRVSTPGGGGYGNAFERDPELVAKDVNLGYYTAEEIRERFGVALNPDGSTDFETTFKLRDST